MPDSRHQEGGQPGHEPGGDTECYGFTGPLNDEAFQIERTHELGEGAHGPPGRDRGHY